MRHAQDYQAIISDQGIPVFMLPFSKSKAKDAVLLYDGGNHATLYRTDDDVILLDYLPDELKPILKKCTWAVILETNPDGSEIINDYKVKVKSIKNNPHTDNLP